MPLSPGTRFGPYQIEAPLGAGGMGEVYRARDTRLDRRVALKILSSDVAADPEFRERFDREARTLSHLNHRHVCTLYDVGHEAGTGFLVMEYLEGETLAARLQRVAGPVGLPLDEAIRIGIEVADALDAAHQVGITHRDLKPGNVMLTKGGAKLLDFGLAKGHPDAGLSTSDAAAPTRISSSPPVDAPLTASGMLIGTLPYMAPEQVEGRGADARTDLFAFGAVLYEMVTGRRPFQGSTSAALSGSILRDEPPAVSSIQTTAPPALDFLVRRCLAKDPDERWQSARDLKSQLEWIAQNRSPSGVTPAAVMPAPAESGRRRFVWIAACAAALGLVGPAGFLAGRWRSPSGVTRTEDVRFLVSVPTMPEPQMVTVSPDGRYIAFVARKPESPDVVLWLRPLASTTAQPLPGTEGAYSPFWSPDSKSIGFAADGRVKRVALDGLRPSTVCEVPAPADFSGGAWGWDNVLIFSNGVALFRASADGGEVKASTTVDRSRGESMHYYPSFLPDGRHFLFLIRGTVPANSGVFLTSVDTPDTAEKMVRERVIETASMALYAAPGYVIYQDSGSLMALPFDADRLHATGAPVRTSERVSFSFSGRTAVSVSATGVLAYRTSSGEPPVQLTWYDRGGKPVGAVGQPTTMRQFVLSPDGKRVALDRRDPVVGTYDVYALELSSGVLTRITFDPGDEGDPVWSPDGRSIAYSSTSGKAGIHISKLGGEAAKVALETSVVYLGSWAPDNRLLYHNRQTIFGLPMTGLPQPRLLFESRFGKDEMHVSPDGRWVAYNSNESSRVEVHVASYPAFNAQRQVSSGGGGAPWWRADSQELFYLAPDGKMMSVPVKPGPPQEFGTPVVLFQSPLEAPTLDMDEYAASADGQRFLFMKREGSSTAPIAVVLDWTRLLK